MRMQRTVLLTVLIAGAMVAAAGCEEAVRADRDAVADDLVLALEAVGTQPEGGLPAEVRLTVTNRSAAVVAFTLPRPLVPRDAAEGHEDLPLPCLVLALEDAAGHDEMPLYTDADARRWPKAKQVALDPGEAWTGTYPIEAFVFYGPSGPDGRGTFAKYFWRGEQAVRMRARLVMAEGRAVESDPVTLRCKYEEWLFRDDHDGKGR
jgi:hypothetical protein